MNEAYERGRAAADFSRSCSDKFIDEQPKIKVYGTRYGKLYIKPEELFALPKIQELIRKIANKKLV